MNRGRVFRIACLVVFAAALVSCLNGCASGDPYFMNTRSRANVHILPQPVAVEKIAVLPFRAPTELIGSSVSDMFVTEILRARRYEVVERSGTGDGGIVLRARRRGREYDGCGWSDHRHGG
jgi:curli biogenesis system outer membrane secretion channel CsgG